MISGTRPGPFPSLFLHDKAEVGRAGDDHILPCSDVVASALDIIIGMLKSYMCILKYTCLQLSHPSH